MTAFNPFAIWCWPKGFMYFAWVHGILFWCLSLSLCVYLVKISDEISLFFHRMAWHRKRITVAAVCSAEHIQWFHLSDKGHSHTTCILHKMNFSNSCELTFHQRWRRIITTNAFPRLCLFYKLVAVFSNSCKFLLQ